MKRIHLFEFEDFSWFPNSIRICMTRLLIVMHKILGTSESLSELVVKALKHSEKPQIIDLCSGSGGPMIDVFKKIKNINTYKNLKLILTDLYPNNDFACKINSEKSDISYVTSSVDASDIGSGYEGLRTMVCSFHHMKPETARKIIKDAKECKQPICIFEISDNSFPIWLWWVPLPLNFIMTFFITPWVTPITWQQIVFTYFIPVIPIFFAWDGAVSNARTYTINDMDVLITGLESDDYCWKKGSINGKSNKLYLLGLPTISA